jgi:hypothetical protein
VGGGRKKAGIEAGGGSWFGLPTLPTAKPLKLSNAVVKDKPTSVSDGTNSAVRSANLEPMRVMISKAEYSAKLLKRLGRRSL